MTLTMNISHIHTVEQMEKFLKLEEEFTLSAENKEEVYKWLNNLLVQVKYLTLSKKKRGLVLRYVKKITQYSDKQIKRLITKYKNGNLRWINWQRNTFEKIYDHKDIALLHELDDLLGMSGNATKKIFEREFEIFGKKKYEKLLNISVSHIYNLRSSVIYEALGNLTFTKTKYTPTNIGQRTKPQPNGVPGYFRVDTVHQGDLNERS